MTVRRHPVRRAGPGVPNAGGGSDALVFSAARRWRRGVPAAQPWSGSHLSMTDEEKRRAGIEQSLVRLLTGRPGRRRESLSADRLAGRGGGTMKRVLLLAIFPVLQIAVCGCRSPAPSGRGWRCCCSASRCSLDPMVHVFLHEVCATQPDRFPGERAPGSRCWAGFRSTATGCTMATTTPTTRSATTDHLDLGSRRQPPSEGADPVRVPVARGTGARAHGSGRAGGADPAVSAAAAARERTCSRCAPGARRGVWPWALAWAALVYLAGRRSRCTTTASTCRSRTRVGDEP